MTINFRQPLFWFNAIFGMLCAFFIFKVIVLLLPHGDATLSVNPPQSSSAQALYWSWFSTDAEIGTVGDQSDEPKEQYDELNIDAELLGVVISPHFSSATVRIGRSQEQVVHIGDEIENGIEVTHIERARVVVTQRGRTFQLSFPEPEQQLRRVSASSVGGGARETGQEGFELANMFSAVPVEVSGHAGGLKLGALSQEMRDLVDIREDDVVVQVGTNNIQEMLSNPASWVDFSANTALPVTVIRNGQEIVIYVNALSLSGRLLPELEID